MHEFVSVDLETTGLDPVRDAIIEIGAAHFRDGALVAEFNTLINPHRAIPPEVTQLTGIRDDDVHDAPELGEGLARLTALAGDLPVLGHNVAFDLGFLNQRQALRENTRMDTYELAAILIPGAPRYSLKSLAEVLNVPLATAHRALDDARATGKVYLALRALLRNVPSDLLLEVLDIGRDLNWDGRHPLLDELSQRGVNLADSFERLGGLLANHEDIPAEIPSNPAVKLSDKTVSDFFRPGGPLSRGLDHFEDRPQQAMMAQSVASAIGSGDSIMIEAGTGTGKSMAYLVPAMLWSLENGQRVVVSTQTINLQEQLALNDVPTLRASAGFEFSSAVLKGRANYLCPRRLDAVRQRPAGSVDELRLLAKVLIWQVQSGSGDRGELTMRGPELAYWSRLSAEDRGCVDHVCRTRMGGICPFHQAHLRADSANIVIVNHALLVADAASPAQVIPPYTRVIIDEAHQFEDAVTNGMARQLDAFLMARHLAEIGAVQPARGLLGLLSQFLRGEHSAQQRMKSNAILIGQATIELIGLIDRFFRAILQLAKDQESGDTSQSIRITETVRRTPAFSEAAEAFERCAQHLNEITEAIVDLAKALFRQQVSLSQDFQDTVDALLTEVSFLTETGAWLQQVFFEPDANAVYWISTFLNGTQAGLHSAPVDVSGLVSESILSKAESVVMTSATLRVTDSFEYVTRRLGGEHLATLDVGSPFDYRASTLLFLPTDLPDPARRDAQQAAVEGAILDLATALDGRTLVLFTSYAQLKQTTAAVAPKLMLGGITVYDQGEGSSRHGLVTGFRRSEKAVLFGTRSFWEGVDIPGEALSGLVIVKLPFAVPTDPIVAARSEQYAEPFREYSVPDAVLRFRQGFGRLIRRRSDRGIVTVLDGRLTSKAYGQQFLDSLPECSVHRAPLHTLGMEAARWLELTRS